MFSAIEQILISDFILCSTAAAWGVTKFACALTLPVIVIGLIIIEFAWFAITLIIVLTIVHFATKDRG